MKKTRMFGVLFCLVLNSYLSCGYIQLSSLKSKMFHKILINKKIKTDFKKITSNDAYHIASFWYDELAVVNREELTYQDQGINLLYRPPSHVFETSVNLTDFKYSIISDVENKSEYFIWRPKIQICLPSLHAIETNNDESVKSEELKNTLLYPSFRETMYLLSLDHVNMSSSASVTNIARSPYWCDPKYDSLETLHYSVKNFFVNYLKRQGLKYK